jgi:hypothetical protein
VNVPSGHFPSLLSSALPTAIFLKANGAQLSRQSTLRNLAEASNMLLSNLPSLGPTQQPNIRGFSDFSINIVLLGNSGAIALAK